MDQESIKGVFCIDLGINDIKKKVKNEEEKKKVAVVTIEKKKATGCFIIFRSFCLFILFL